MRNLDHVVRTTSYISGVSGWGCTYIAQVFNKEEVIVGTFPLIFKIHFIRNPDRGDSKMYIPESPGLKGKATSGVAAFKKSLKKDDLTVPMLVYRFKLDRVSPEEALKELVLEPKEHFKISGLDRDDFIESQILERSGRKKYYHPAGKAVYNSMKILSSLSNKHTKAREDLENGKYGDTSPLMSSEVLDWNSVVRTLVYLSELGSTYHLFLLKLITKYPDTPQEKNPWLHFIPPILIKNETVKDIEQKCLSSLKNFYAFLELSWELQKAYDELGEEVLRKGIKVKPQIGEKSRQKPKLFRPTNRKTLLQSLTNEARRCKLHLAQLEIERDRLKKEIKEGELKEMYLANALSSNYIDPLLNVKANLFYELGTRDRGQYDQQFYDPEVADDIFDSNPKLTWAELAKKVEEEAEVAKSSK